jgi:hypothetical protein
VASHYPLSDSLRIVVGRQEHDSYKIMGMPQKPGDPFKLAKTGYGL